MVVHSRNHFVLAKGNIMSKGKVRASHRNRIKQALRELNPKCFLHIELHVYIVLEIYRNT